jgi:ankyrin repeat protein
LDSKGSGAIHWAAYLGSENAVNFLVNWDISLNEKDLDGGYTPLHLGVISGNSRLVRKLLIKGADKNIFDKQGKKPIDIARD